MPDVQSPAPFAGQSPAAAGTAPLSEREIEVLKLVATGATNLEIARALVISPNTVKVHLRNIFEKLGVQSRTEATMTAIRRGWVSVPGAQSLGSGGAQAVGLGTEVQAAVELAPATEPPAVTSLPTRPPIERWQRVYMLLAAVIVSLAALLPGWWQSRGQATASNPFTDMGRPQVAPPLRPQVSRWVSSAPLPEPRSRLALALAGNSLYAIGGETSAGVTGQVAIYDTESNTWLRGADKPTPVSNVAAAVVGDHIYVPGGTMSDGTVTNSLEAYDFQADRWETRAALPVPLSAYGLAVLDDKLYLFGGWDGESYRTDAYRYDPATDRWSSVTPMPAARGFLAASPVDDVIFVVGGYDGERELDTVEVYDPAAEGSPAGPWSRRASLSQARGGLGLATVGSRLYAVGGGWTAPLAFNEQYDLQTGAWSRFEAPMVGEWRNLSLVPDGKKVHVVGGWSGSYLAANEAYQVLLRQLLPFSSKGD